MLTLFCWHISSNNKQTCAVKHGYNQSNPAPRCVWGVQIAADYLQPVIFAEVVGPRHSFQTCSGPRMDRNLQITYFWWFIVLISVSTLTESRLVRSRGSSGTHGNIQPQLTAVKEQQSAELSARPRPVAVNCHPDSMEVVVQADIFDTDLQVDGRHLRLGSHSLSDGSACGAVPSGEAEFTIRAHLMDCGTKLSVGIIYIFNEVQITWTLFTHVHVFNFWFLTCCQHDDVMLLCRIYTLWNIAPFSPHKRRSSILMSWSTHLNLHLMVCLDWMEQLFQLNVIMKSEFCTFWHNASWILIWFYPCIRLLGHLNSAENQLLKYCYNRLSCFQEVCCGWHFPASHLGSFCRQSLSRESDRLQSAPHDRY